MEEIRKVISKVVEDSPEPSEPKPKPPAEQGEAPVRDMGNCIANCEICGGLGYIRKGGGGDIHDPNFGKLTECPNRVTKLILSEAVTGIPEAEAQNMLEGKYTPTIGQVKPLKAIDDLIKRGYGWLYMYGFYGTGKTTLLKLGTIEALKAGRRACYARLADILENLRAAFDSKRPSEEAATRINYWSSVDFLFIDEFDKVRSTEYADEKRFLLMDNRYLSAIGKQTATIMASNVPPDKYEGYIRDRIEDGRFTVMDMGQDSVRPAMDWVNK